MTVSLPIAPAVGDVRGYCVLSNHYHIQILDVSHDLLNGFVSGLPFSSPPSPSPIGRPDTQAIHKQPKPRAENRMHGVNRRLSKISPWNYIINKLSKLRSHLVYIASRNKAQIWINSDIWLSFSHRLFHTCMAYYFWDVTRDWFWTGGCCDSRRERLILLFVTIFIQKYISTLRIV